MSLPAVHLEDVRELLPLALACFFVGAVETAAIGRMFAEKHGYRLDNNHEFLALAGANLASGLGHGFPLSGGMSHSLVNESGASANCPSPRAMRVPAWRECRAARAALACRIAP